jgi:hypothetical protein
MYRRSLSIFLLIFLTVLQAAQGVFTGGALCREETGAVTLEWARDGQCESAVGRAIELDHQGFENESASSEHCGPCFDIPLPSETSLRSIVNSSDVLLLGISISTVTGLAQGLLENSSVLPAPFSAPGSLATAHLGAVRLLI